MNNYTTLTRYKAATPRSARRQKGYTVPTISLPSGNSVSLGGVVMLSGEQTITSIKDFLAGLKIGGLLVYSSKPDTIFVDANLAVRGAITMYADNGQAAPSIWDGFPYDDETIKRNAAGKFYAVGGGGSGTGGGISIADVEYYLTTNGYATQNWVTGKGYITSDALEPYALKTAIPTSLKNPNALSWSGYSSGSYDGSTAQSITIPNNTNQLNNGAGFITSITSSMVTNALGYTPLSTSGGTITGGVTITAAADSPLKINSAATDSGIYFNHNGVPKTWVGFEASRGSVLYHSLGSHRLGINNDGVAFYDSNTLLHSGNYSNYALPKDGTAVAATTLKTSTGYMYARAFNVDKIVDIGADATFQGYSTYIDGMYIRFRYGSANATAMQIGTDGNVSIGGTTATEKLHVHGNMLFEGERVLKSSLIGEVLYMGGSYLVIGGGTTTKGIPTYIDGKTVYVRAGNYVATFSDAGGLTWNGNLLTNGAITMYYSSDERLKKNIRKVNASEVLMSLGGIWRYEYIDSEVQKNSVYDGTHFGLIYQNVKGTALDKMCHKREDGMGALNYLDANFISLIAGATMENISEVEKLKKENKSLRKRVEQLEKRIA